MKVVKRELAPILEEYQKKLEDKKRREDLKFKLENRMKELKDRQHVFDNSPAKPLDNAQHQRMVSFGNKDDFQCATEIKMPKVKEWTYQDSKNQFKISKKIDVFIPEESKSKTIELDQSQQKQSKYPNILKDLDKLPPNIRELHEYAARDYGNIPKTNHHKKPKKVNWMRNIDLVERKQIRHWVDTNIFKDK